MNYNEQMKEIRIENKKLQKDIAKILNISPFTYSHYETKDNIIPINHLIKFCDYFNISLNYIFGLVKEKSQNSFSNSNTKITGERLKELRKENKLTQNKLASFLNTTQAVIANYERGRNYIATPFLYAICKKYNISADYLLGRNDTPKYLK